MRPKDRWEADEADPDERAEADDLGQQDEQEVVLKDPKGQLTTVKAADVEALVPQQQSMMPELLLRDLTAQQVADLLAFLGGLTE